MKRPADWQAREAALDPARSFIVQAPGMFIPDLAHTFRGKPFAGKFEVFGHGISDAVA